MMRCVLFISTLIVAALIAGNSHADTNYTVRKGDNPYTIAKKFRVSPEDIIRTNDLDPRRLRPGTRISIPGQVKKKQISAPEVVAMKEPVPAQKESSDSPLHRESPSFHIVKKGDTISSLSRKYGISKLDLMEMNDLRSPSLKIGQRIDLKRSDACEYTVRKGDTIWSIARRFDIEPAELMELNNLETNSLKPNQKILVKHPTDPTTIQHYEAILSHAPEEQIIHDRVSEDHKTWETGAHTLQERIVLFAHKLLDIPYRFGGNSLLGIDCSAYVKKVYSMVGIDLPRSAREQFSEGIPVDEDNLSIGDLVFFRTYASYPSHVGIYLGNNLFIHASSKKKRVTIDSLDTPFYLKRFIGAKRLLDMTSSGRYFEKES
mgnify:CR=1 FL=1